MKNGKFVFFFFVIGSFYFAEPARLCTAQEFESIRKNGQPRTLADLIRSMDQATIQKGFILHLFTNEEVRQIEESTTEHNKRHQEFTEKSNLLEKRTSDLNRNSPSRFSRAIATSESLFVRYDRDKNGILSGNEVASARANTEDMDANSDNRVDKKEFMRWMISKLDTQRRRRGGPAAPPRAADPFAIPRPAVPAGAAPPNRVAASDKEIDELIAERDAIMDLQRKLRNEYKETTSYRPPKAYYKIMEATNEFVRLRNEKEERILPIASIQEFRRSVNQGPTDFN